jgi:hypothetical protein
LNDPRQQRQLASEGDVHRAADPRRRRVFDTPLPPFMKNWRATPDDRDCYELPELDSLSSHKPSDAGPPPGKRSWPFAGNMSPVDLAQWDCTTLSMVQPPHVQVSDFDEGPTRLTTPLNLQKSTYKGSELPGSPIRDELAMTRASSSDVPPNLDADTFVAEVKNLSLSSHQHVLLELSDKKSFDDMADFAKTLESAQGVILLNQARRWIETSDPLLRGPAQLMALLTLFTSYTPRELDELMNLLPLTWPAALEHLRAACLNGRADLVKHESASRRKTLLALLQKRYGE